MTPPCAIGVLKGNGVGARLPFYGAGGVYVGTLGFHDGNDWQVVDSSNAERFGWCIFEKALADARRRYPRAA